MLETALKAQLRTIFAPLDSRYTFLIRLNPRHENRNELIELIEDVASCSEKIEVLIPGQTERARIHFFTIGHPQQRRQREKHTRRELTETYSSLEGTDPVNYLCILNMYELSG